MAVGTLITGNGGAVTLPTGFNFKVTGWSAQYTPTTVENTGFDDAGFETHDVACTAMTATVNGVGSYDAATTAPLPASVVDGAGMAVGDLASLKASLTLTATTGCSYAFTGVCTGVSFTRNAKGQLEITANYRSSGAITQTWDESGA